MPNRPTLRRMWFVLLAWFLAGISTAAAQNITLTNTTGDFDICEGDPLSFEITGVNASDVERIEYVWGDGSRSILDRTQGQSITLTNRHIYSNRTNAGNDISVSALVRLNDGTNLQAQLSDDIRVFEVPRVDIRWEDDSIQCFAGGEGATQNDFRLVDSSSYDDKYTSPANAFQEATVFWGDGQAVGFNQPGVAFNHTYRLPGTYVIGVTVTDSVGCRNTISDIKEAEVLEPLNVEYTIDDVELGCPISTYEFTNTTDTTPLNREDVRLLEYQWIFGDENKNGVIEASEVTSGPPGGPSYEDTIYSYGGDQTTIGPSEFSPNLVLRYKHQNSSQTCIDSFRQESGTATLNFYFDLESSVVDNNTDSCFQSQGEVIFRHPDPGGVQAVLWTFGDPASGPANIANNPELDWPVTQHAYTAPGNYQVHLALQFLTQAGRWSIPCVVDTTYCDKVPLKGPQAVVNFPTDPMMGIYPNDYQDPERIPNSLLFPGNNAATNFFVLGPHPDPNTDTILRFPFADSLRWYGPQQNQFGFTYSTVDNNATTDITNDPDVLQYAVAYDCEAEPVATFIDTFSDFTCMNVRDTANPPADPIAHYNKDALGLPNIVGVLNNPPNNPSTIDTIEIDYNIREIPVYRDTGLQDILLPYEETQNTEAVGNLPLRLNPAGAPYYFPSEGDFYNPQLMHDTDLFQCSDTDNIVTFVNNSIKLRLDGSGEAVYARDNYPRGRRDPTQIIGGVDTIEQAEYVLTRYAGSNNAAFEDSLGGAFSSLQYDTDPRFYITVDLLGNEVGRRRLDSAQLVQYTDNNGEVEVVDRQKVWAPYNVYDTLDGGTDTVATTPQASIQNSTLQIILNEPLPVFVNDPRRCDPDKLFASDSLEYQWNFGDPYAAGGPAYTEANGNLDASISFEKTPKHRYTYDSCFTASLTVRDTVSGCQAQAQVQIAMDRADGGFSDNLNDTLKAHALDVEQVFESTLERTNYYANNPGELRDGLVVQVGGRFTQYFGALGSWGKANNNLYAYAKEINDFYAQAWQRVPQRTDAVNQVLDSVGISQAEKFRLIQELFVPIINDKDTSFNYLPRPILVFIEEELYPNNEADANRSIRTGFTFEPIQQDEFYIINLQNPFKRHRPVFGNSETLPTCAQQNWWIEIDSTTNVQNNGQPVRNFKRLFEFDANTGMPNGVVTTGTTYNLSSHLDLNNWSAPRDMYPMIFPQDIGYGQRGFKTIGGAIQNGSCVDTTWRTNHIYLANPNPAFAVDCELLPFDRSCFQCKDYSEIYVIEPLQEIDSTTEFSFRFRAFDPDRPTGNYAVKSTDFGWGSYRFNEILSQFTMPEFYVVDTGQFYAANPALRNALRNPGNQQFNYEHRYYVDSADTFAERTIELDYQVRRTDLGIDSFGFRLIRADNGRPLVEFRQLDTTEFAQIVSLDFPQRAGFATEQQIGSGFLYAEDTTGNFPEQREVIRRVGSNFLIPKSLVDTVFTQGVTDTNCAQLLADADKQRPVSLPPNFFGDKLNVITPDQDFTGDSLTLREVQERVLPELADLTMRVPLRCTGPKRMFIQGQLQASFFGDSDNKSAQTNSFWRGMIMSLQANAQNVNDFNDQGFQQLCPGDTAYLYDSVRYWFPGIDPLTGIPLHVEAGIFYNPVASYQTPVGYVRDADEFESRIDKAAPFNPEQDSVVAESYTLYAIPDVSRMEGAFPDKDRFNTTFQAVEVWGACCDTPVFYDSLGQQMPVIEIGSRDSAMFADREALAFPVADSAVNYSVMIAATDSVGKTFFRIYKDYIRVPEPVSVFSMDSLFERNFLKFPFATVDGDDSLVYFTLEGDGVQASYSSSSYLINSTYTDPRTCEPQPYDTISTYAWILRWDDEEDREGQRYALTPGSDATFGAVYNGPDTIIPALEVRTSLGCRVTGFMNQAVQSSDTAELPNGYASPHELIIFPGFDPNYFIRFTLPPGFQVVRGKIVGPNGAPVFVRVDDQGNLLDQNGNVIAPISDLLPPNLRFENGQIVDGNGNVYTLDENGNILGPEGRVRGQIDLSGLAGYRIEDAIIQGPDGRFLFIDDQGNLVDNNGTVVLPEGSEGLADLRGALGLQDPLNYPDSVRDITQSNLDTLVICTPIGLAFSDSTVQNFDRVTYEIEWGAVDDSLDFIGETNNVSFSPDRVLNNVDTAITIETIGLVKVVLKVAAETVELPGGVELDSTLADSLGLDPSQVGNLGLNEEYTSSLVYLAAPRITSEFTAYDGQNNIIGDSAQFCVGEELRFVNDRPGFANATWLIEQLNTGDTVVYVEGGFERDKVNLVELDFPNTPYLRSGFDPEDMDTGAYRVTLIPEPVSEDRINIARECFQPKEFHFIYKDVEARIATGKLTDEEELGYGVDTLRSNVYYALDSSSRTAISRDWIIPYIPTDSIVNTGLVQFLSGDSLGSRRIDRLNIEVPFDSDSLVYNFGYYEGDSVYVGLIVRNDIGCYDTAYATLRNEVPADFYVYNIFTPNGDQKNEVLKVPFGGIALEFSIYNRWNERVYHMEQIEDAERIEKLGAPQTIETQGEQGSITVDRILWTWDGTNLNDGSQCEPGTYFYEATYKLRDGQGTRTSSGSITLIR